MFKLPLTIQSEERGLEIPDNLFVQNIQLNNGLNLNVVFGVHDRLTDVFDNKDFLIMNQKWSDFTKYATIFESDLWTSNIEPEHRTLMNAKLYTISSVYLDQQDMNSLNNYFWIDILRGVGRERRVNRWRQSMRASLADILQLENLDLLFEQRRLVQNRDSKGSVYQQYCY